MKNRLNHHSLFDIKLLDKKINFQDISHIVRHNFNRFKEEIFTDTAYKTTLFYLSSALSILFLMAFVQLSDFERIVKVLMGISILSVNVWLLKMYNL